MLLRPEVRTCTKCKETLPVSQFHKERRNSAGLQRWCKECSNTYRRIQYMTPERRQSCRDSRKRYYKANAAAVTLRTRKNEIRRKYNLEWDQYQSLLEAQSHKCALCETDKPGGKGGWHVDHNHETGDVRGLLCHLCNTRLGTYQRFQREIGMVAIETYLASVAVPGTDKRKTRR